MADTKFVYVVSGFTGKYDDYSEWDIIAYLDEERAQEHVDRAKDRHGEICFMMSRRGLDWYDVYDGAFFGTASEPLAPMWINEFDPKVPCSLYFENTCYKYTKVPLGE